MEKEDNWLHRSAKMKCSTCMWWVRKVVGDPIGPTNLTANHLGRCRRHAPTMSGWTPVFDTDWCGDHRLDENKID